MTLVGEAGLNRRLGGGLTTGQELSRKTHAPLNKVGMRCYTYFACKAPQKLETTHAQHCR
jgi:hypothetical protein